MLERLAVSFVLQWPIVSKPLALHPLLNRYSQLAVLEGELTGSQICE